MSTFYENAKKAMQAQIDGVQARCSMSDPSFDPDDPETKKNFEKNMLEHAADLAVAILVRLDVINNPRNDEAHATARDLVKALCTRLDIDPFDRLGINV
jgi:hypothetical protein